MAIISGMTTPESSALPITKGEAGEERDQQQHQPDGGRDTVFRRRQTLFAEVITSFSEETNSAVIAVGFRREDS
jgi:hypothetical protein